MMTAVISTTYDDKYFFLLPITTWCWNKLGIDVICFIPKERNELDYKKMQLLFAQNAFLLPNFVQFDAPADKKVTYAQCSRLFAASLNGIPDKTVLISSDVDMAVFGNYFEECIAGPGEIHIHGYDLTPPGQYPICYVQGDLAAWRKLLLIERDYQQHLDDLLGNIECEHFAGNYWCKDQETLYNAVSANRVPVVYKHRAQPGTQFATRRLDRDDTFMLERLSPDIIDYHMHRPGYTDGAFANILAVLSYFYPNEDFQWLIDYRDKYLKLNGQEQ